MRAGVSTVAVIDIGSNSARVVVFRVAADGCAEVLADERASLRLIREIDAQGRLKRRAIESTLVVLRDFRQLARACGAKRVIGVATAAVREAANGGEFLDRVRRELGLRILALDAASEARNAFLGAVYGLPVEHGLVLDIGGGSAELAQFRKRRLRRVWSLPLGALLLNDRFLKGDPPGRGEIHRLRAHAQKTLAAAGIPSMKGDDVLVGTGGTIRNLAKVDARRRDYPVPRLHGYELTRHHLQEVGVLLASNRSSARAALPGLNSERADSIVGGSLVAELVMDHIGADRLVVAGQGVREGIVLASTGIGMPTPETVRARSIAALAARFASWDAARARRRCALVADLRRVMSPHASPMAREILDHAAYVLDIGRSIDYYRRHQHTAMILRTTGLLGFMHRDILLVAAVVALADDEDQTFRRYRPMMQARELASLRRAGILLALADEIEQRLPAAHRPHVNARDTGDALVLRMDALSTWDPPKFRDRFRRAFGRDLEIAAPRRSRS